MTQNHTKNKKPELELRGEWLEQNRNLHKQNKEPAQHHPAVAQQCEGRTRKHTGRGMTVVVKENVCLEVWTATEMNGIFLVHPQRYPSPVL